MRNARAFAFGSKTTVESGKRLRGGVTQLFPIRASCSIENRMPFLLVHIPHKVSKMKAKYEEKVIMQ
jgi:hypothetical protein